LIAYILTGGAATRVKEITEKYNCEKHEIPICGKPFNKYMESWLRDQPIIDGIEYLNQPRVGTGGAIKTVEPASPRILHFPFLLIYGDCFSPIDVTRLYEDFLRRKADMEIVTRKVTDPDYGLIVLPRWRSRTGWDSMYGESVYEDSGSNYTEPINQYTRHHDAEPPYITNTGTYMIGRRAYEYIRNQPWRDGGISMPVDGLTLSLEHHIFDRIFDTLDVYAYDCSDLPYYDVGTPERIKETEAMLSAST